MSWFHEALRITVAVVEVLAYLIIVTSLLRSLWELLVIDHLNMHQFYVSTTLTDGIIGALELLMVAEVMKTMLAFELMEILTLTILIVLRVFLTAVLRYEQRESMALFHPRVRTYFSKVVHDHINEHHEKAVKPHVHEVVYQSGERQDQSSEQQKRENKRKAMARARDLRENGHNSR